MDSKSVIFILLFVLFFEGLAIAPCTPSDTNHVTGTDPTNSHICTCEQHYIFKPTIHTCVRDCQKITHALPNCKQPRTNLDKCNCEANYIWVQLSYSCARNCSGVKNSNGKYDANHIEQCECADPINYQWSEQYQQCVRICSASTDTHITGPQLTAPYTTCLCQNGYNFSPETNSCVGPICNGDVHTHTDGGQCVCNTGYELHTYAGDTVQKCGRLCSLSDSTLGKL